MIFWFENIGNDCSHNRVNCWFTSCVASSKHGFYVEYENLRRSLVFAICKSDDIIPQSNWLFHNNVYVPPKDNSK